MYAQCVVYEYACEYICVCLVQFVCMLCVHGKVCRSGNSPKALGASPPNHGLSSPVQQHSMSRPGLRTPSRRPVAEDSLGKTCVQESSSPCLEILLGPCAKIRQVSSAPKFACEIQSPQQATKCFPALTFRQPQVQEGTRRLNTVKVPCRGGFINSRIGEAEVSKLKSGSW